MIIVDSFCKGSYTHNTCQDYVIHGYDPFPYVILADGCSSSKNSDIGARILCHCAKMFLINEVEKINLISTKKMIEEILKKSLSISKDMGLEISALDATLMMCFIFEGKRYVVNVFGDGMIINRKTSNNINFNIKTIEYASNAPYYLSYQIDKHRKDIYENAMKENYNNQSQKVHRYFLIKDNNGKTLSLSSSVERTHYTRIFSYLNYLEEGSAIIICSDGFNSFFNRETKEFLTIEDIIYDITNFQTTAGSFLHRRLGSKTGLLSQLEKKGFLNRDDLSIGAIINVR